MLHALWSLPWMVIARLVLTYAGLIVVVMSLFWSNGPRDVKKRALEKVNR